MSEGIEVPKAVGEYAVEEVERLRARLAKYEDAEGNPLCAGEESELEKVLVCGDASHDEQAEAAHHIRLLANALGECIQAAGITAPGAALDGPQLLMFAEDLKRHVEQARAAMHGKDGMP